MKQSKSIEAPILTIREQRVILDSDLARLYGTTTKALNQAVKRNRDRFPDDFAFRLTASEFEISRSQTEILSTKHIDKMEKLNRSQIVTGPGKHRNQPTLTLLIYAS